MSFKKPERYPDSKTDEGYNDPTAAAAMKRVDIDYNPDDFGLILTRSTYDAGLEYYVQLQDFGPCGNLVVPMIQRDKWIGETTPHMLSYRLNNVNYYIDCRKFRTLNPRWIVGSEGYVSKNTQTSIRTIMMRMLGFNIPETQTVEKIVEKPVKEIVEVEKPVEVVQADPRASRDALEQLEFLESQRDAVQGAVLEQQVPEDHRDDHHKMKLMLFYPPQEGTPFFEPVCLN